LKAYICVSRIAELCANNCASQWHHCVAVAALAGLLYHAEVYCEKLGRAAIPISATGFTHSGFRAKKLWPERAFPTFGAYRSSGLSVAQILARNRSIAKYPWIELLRTGRDVGYIHCSAVKALLEVACL